MRRRVVADTTDRGTELDNGDATRVDAFPRPADRSSGVLHRVLRRRPEDICGELACTPARVHLQLERRAVAVVADPELNDRTGRHRRGRRAVVVVGCHRPGSHRETRDGRGPPREQVPRRGVERRRGIIHHVVIVGKEGEAERRTVRGR